jgi:dienelactone hydrolase
MKQKIQQTIFATLIMGVSLVTSSACDTTITSTYHPLQLVEFQPETYLHQRCLVRDPLFDSEFKKLCLQRMDQEGIPTTPEKLKEYATNLVSTLYFKEAPLVLKYPTQYVNFHDDKGKEYCFDRTLYETLRISMNVYVYYLHEISKDLACFTEVKPPLYPGVKLIGLNLFKTNKLKSEYFTNPTQFQAHAIVGQSLRLEGSFGEIMQKALTLDDVKVKELATLPCYLITPPKNTCHGGAVVLLPSSSNISEKLIEHAQWLSTHGFVTLLVDTYYSSGNVSELTALKNPLEVPMQNEIIAAYRARQILCSHPYVNKNKVGIGGFSRGGTVADLTSRAEFYTIHSHDGNPFAFQYSYYPSIILQQLKLNVSSSPKLYLTGDQDPFVDVANTQSYINRLKDMGIDAQIKVYMGATHSFDTEKPSENKDFPIVSNGPVNLFYDAKGFIPREQISEENQDRHPWDSLYSYIASKIKFGYKQIPNLDATQQAKEDLMTWLKLKVEN